MSKISIERKVGNNCEVSNAHTVEIHSHFNGSGDDAFGGAREWPHVTAKIGFQVGEERRAIDFARKVTELIREEFSQ